MSRLLLRRPQFRGGGAATTVPPTVALTDTENSSADLAAYTFAAQNLGTNVDRLLVVAVGLATSSSRVTSGVTLGGVAMTGIAGAAIGFTTGHSSLWYIHRASGADLTADIVATASGGSTACHIAVYELIGLDDETPVLTGENVDINGSIDFSLAPAYSLVIAASRTRLGTAYTWGGVTEQFDTTMDTAQVHSSGAIALGETPGVTITTTVAGSPSHQSTVAAAWR
jgi:hypothetical protein